MPYRMFPLGLCVLKVSLPKLILLYEDIEEEGKPGSKRYRLTGKHYFGGGYKGAEANEDLWLEV